jgi:hypothetical protein
METKNFFNMKSPHIASWVNNPDEKVSLNQALSDWYVVQSRPDEFSNNIVDNIVVDIMQRFCITSEQELDYKLSQWEVYGNAE